MSDPQSEVPQPNQPTMNLLAPEVRGFIEGLRWLWQQRRADHSGRDHLVS